MVTIIWTATKARFTYAQSGCGTKTGGFWHSRFVTAGMFTHTRSRRGRICHLLRTQMVWSAWFRSGRGNLGVGPICRSGFWSCSATAYVWTHVMICIEGNFLPASARVRSAHVWTYLYWVVFFNSIIWTVNMEWNSIVSQIILSYLIDGKSVLANNTYQWLSARLQ